MTRAAAALIRPSQCATGAGIGSPDTGKLSTALSVSPPQSLLIVSSSQVSRHCIAGRALCRGNRRRLVGATSRRAARAATVSRRRRAMRSARAPGWKSKRPGRRPASATSDTPRRAGTSRARRAPAGRIRCQTPHRLSRRHVRRCVRTGPGGYAPRAAARSSSQLQSFTRGRPCGSPAARSAASIACQPSYVTTSNPSLREQRVDVGGGRLRPRQPALARVLEQQLDRLGRVLLVRADHAARAALDPARAVDPGDGCAVGVEHAAAVVRHRRRSLVEGHAREARRRGSRRCGTRCRTGSPPARRSARRGRGRRRRRRARCGRPRCASTCPSPRISTGETQKRRRERARLARRASRRVLAQHLDVALGRWRSPRRARPRWPGRARAPAGRRSRRRRRARRAPAAPGS